MELCSELKRLYPDIILVSATTDQIKQILLQKSKVRAVMFGRFQLFVGDELVYFSNAKAKELLALCLDHRGGEVTMEEAIDKLWPDRIYDERVKKLYRKAVMSLQATLKEAGAEEIFITKRGSCYANVANIECDYFQFLETRDSEVSLYDGTYLFDYGWGEETLAMLERIVGM
jgi:two-component SAPR family response regulator